MPSILIINGPNLNLLGMRQPEIYGTTTYPQLEQHLYTWGKDLGFHLSLFQSNGEKEIIDRIQQGMGQVEGIIINGGGYSHTSVAILDALLAVGLPVIEVHITEISSRENFRQFSYISTMAEKVITGKGILGYKEALHSFSDYFS